MVEGKGRVRGEMRRRVVGGGEESGGERGEEGERGGEMNQCQTQESSPESP